METGGTGPEPKPGSPPGGGHPPVGPSPRGSAVVPAAPPPPPQRHPALEGVELAGWWSRAGALLIDALVLLVITLVVGGVLGLVVYAGAQASTVLAVLVGVLSGFVLIGLLIMYAPFVMAREGARNGQTYGKQALGIRVVQLDGRPFTLGTAALREIAVKGLMMGVAGSVSAGVAQLLDYLWPLWDVNRQALHDKVVSSAVVRSRRPAG